MVTRRKSLSLPSPGDGPLGIEQLEAALRRFGEADIDSDAYWDEHIEAFRKTVLLAIRETADAILQGSIPQRWRAELEDQLAMLGRCIELADQYRRLRSLSRGRQSQASPRLPRSIH